MKNLFLTLLIACSGAAFAGDCSSDDSQFIFQNGKLMEADTEESIEISSSQVVDVLSVTTEPCVFVGDSLVDVEVVTRLIQLNHNYMGQPHQTQFVCSGVTLKAAQCGE